MITRPFLLPSRQELIMNGHAVRPMSQSRCRRGWWSGGLPAFGE